MKCYYVMYCQCVQYKAPTGALHEMLCMPGYSTRALSNEFVSGQGQGGSVHPSPLTHAEALCYSSLPSEYVHIRALQFTG